MIHFRNKAGFTLIEVLLSLAIIALVLTPIFVVQGTVLSRVGRYARMIDRFMQSQLFFVNSSIAVSAEAKSTTLEKKIDVPLTFLSYEFQKLPDSSPLKNFKDVYQEKVTIRYEDDGRKYLDSLVSFRYRPEEKKEAAQKK